jgi:hypothetical protein
VITLASDFGSPYPAAMKGVVLRRSAARLVDVAHDLPRQDVRAAAFWLRETLPLFPAAVHLAVVDPGVGTGRSAIAVRAGAHVLVGPDNGSLFPPARRIAASAGSHGHDGPDAIDSADDPDATRDSDGADRAGGRPPVEVFEIEYGDPASSTFHGRDVFAPAAAEVHEAIVGRAGDGRWERADVVAEALAALDGIRPIERADAEDLALPEATIEGDVAVGEVVVVDDFGNAVTNVPGAFLAGRDAALVDGERAPVVDTFAAVAPGERLLTVGSHGYVECDVNRGRGDEAFGLASRSEVRIERLE